MTFVTRRWLGAPILLIAGLWIYATTIHGACQWDDNLEIFRNPLLRDWTGLRQAWSAPPGADYLPLKTSVEWVMWHLWRGDVAGYHWAGIALHLLSAFLLWRIFDRLGIRFAWFGALLFVVHPLAVDSVAWMSELKNTLSLPPLLLAMWSFIAFEENRSAVAGPNRFGARTNYALSWLGFLAALLCKSSVVMFPAVLVLYVVWRNGRHTARDLKRVAPFFAVAFAFGLVTLRFQTERAIGDLAMPVEPVFTHFVAAGLALGFYFYTCVFPAALSPVYARWDLNPVTPAHVLPWVVIAVGFVGFWRWRATWGRHALFASGCFVANLVPVLGFFPMSYLRISRVADHFAYLALACACGAAAAAAGELFNWADSGHWPPIFRTRLRVVASGGIAALVVSLAWQSRTYAAVFRDPVALWTHAVGQSPESWFARNNLGSALLQEGDAATALGHLEAARRLKPDAAEILVNLGDALLRLHRAPEAIEADHEAVKLEPGFSSAHYNLANALVAAGRLPDSLGHYREAIRLEPDSAMMRYNFGTALAEAGRLDEGVIQLAEAVRLDPESPEMRINFANVLAAAGRLPDAAAQFEVSLRLRPDDADGHFGLADVLAAMGRLPEAMPHYEAALRARPDDAAIRQARDAARIRFSP